MGAENRDEVGMSQVAQAFKEHEARVAALIESVESQAAQVSQLIHASIRNTNVELTPLIEGVQQLQRFVDLVHPSELNTVADVVKEAMKETRPVIDTEPIITAIQEMNFNFNARVDLSPVLTAIGGVQQTNVELARVIQESLSSAK